MGQSEFSRNTFVWIKQHVTRQIQNALIFLLFGDGVTNSMSMMSLFKNQGTEAYPTDQSCLPCYRHINYLPFR